MSDVQVRRRVSDIELIADPSLTNLEIGQHEWSEPFWGRLKNHLMRWMPVGLKPHVAGMALAAGSRRLGGPQAVLEVQLAVRPVGSRKPVPWWDVSVAPLATPLRIEMEPGEVLEVAMRMRGTMLLESSPGLEAKPMALWREGFGWIA